MSIGNLSSAPDQAGPRSEHHDPMDLHLSLPDSLPGGFAHGTDGWFVAAPQALATTEFSTREFSTTEFSTAELSTAATVQSATSEDDDSGGAASTIVSFLPLLLIVAAVYFLLLRPRQRQMRQQRELQSTLDVGDEVMLTSGVYGFITGFEQGTDIVWVEIDDDVQIRVSRAAVSGKVDTAGAAAAPGETGGDGTSELASPTSRRPTLKGGGATKPTAAPEPAPAGESTTGETADE